MFKPIIVCDNKEFVSQRIFAERLHCDVQTVHRYIKKKALVVTNIEGHDYLEFDVNKKAYLRENTKNLKFTQKRYRPTAELKLEGVQIEKIGELPSIEEEQETGNIDDLTKLKWQDYTDCLQYNSEMEATINSVSNTPLIDYEVAKLRFAAEKFRLEINEAREPYLEIEQNELFCNLVEKLFLKKDFAKQYTQTIHIHNTQLKDEELNAIYKLISKEESYFKERIANILKEQREMSSKNDI